jgi:outer membrane protein assembly factor BamB
VWKFRAAPDDRNIVAFGQVESAWPLMGGVVVEEGVVYCVAGRSTELDGGLYGYALQAENGKVLWQAKGPRTKAKRFAIITGGPLNNMGIVTGNTVSFHKWTIDLVKPRKFAKSERIPGNSFDHYWHFRIKRKSLPMQYLNGVFAQMIAHEPNRIAAYIADNWRKNLKETGKIILKDNGKGWESEVKPPIQVEALVLAKNSVIASGPADYLKRDKGFLWVFDAKDGKKHTDITLDAPVVSNSIAVAQGKVFFATNDGNVFCFSGK